ncbi:MAG: glycosyltransferase family 1 protein [Deltaproteobacteria bacterium]|nr:MAG: glycosyltransferase family 1 protein [Deltaproteobacteria bacterium]
MTEGLRILHIETGRHLYGGALQVLYLLKGLKQKGHQNILACLKASAIETKAMGFALVHALPAFGELDPRQLFWLLKIIRTIRPHIVHVHSRRGADLWGGMAAKLARSTAIITRRVDNPEHPYIARLKYDMYEKVVTISQGITRILVAEGIPPSKITCIYSAVDVDKYSGACNKDWFLREFSLSSDQKAVGMVAQFIPRKGHRSFLEIVPLILEKCPNTKFLLFGRGPLESEIQRACQDKGLSNAVLFAGFREDMENIFPCLDLLVHPATMEGLGVALLEAGAAGVPVVATEAGGIPEIVQHGKTGRLVKIGQPVQFAHEVVRLLTNTEMARQYGRSAKEYVRANFSIQKMVTNYLALYGKLVHINQNHKVPIVEPGKEESQQC